MATKKTIKGTRYKQRRRAKVYFRDEGKCVYCLQNIAQEEMHLDHVIPLARGGANNIDNLVASCQICQHEKRDKALNQLPSDVLSRVRPKILAAKNRGIDFPLDLPRLLGQPMRKLNGKENGQTKGTEGAGEGSDALKKAGGRVHPELLRQSSR